MAAIRNAELSWRCLKFSPCLLVSNSCLGAVQRTNTPERFCCSRAPVTPSAHSEHWCALEEMDFSCSLACDRASTDQGNPWKLLALPQQNQNADEEGAWHPAAWEDKPVWAWQGRISTKSAHRAAGKCLKLGGMSLFSLNAQFLAFLWPRSCRCRSSAGSKPALCGAKRFWGWTLGEREEGGKLRWDGAGSWLCKLRRLFFCFFLKNK